MRKKLIIIIVSIVLVLTIFFIIGNGRTKVYLCNEVCGKNNAVDLLVKIGDQEIFNDSIGCNPYDCQTRNTTLNWGFHKVKVFSNELSVDGSANIFIFFKHHLVIDLYCKKKNQSEDCLQIINRFTEYRTE